MVKQPKERRKHPRYQAEDETALMTAPKLILSDNLLDISMGGLAFSYEDKVPLSVGRLFIIDIIRNEISIADIPAHIISDIDIPDSPFFSRRCGVEFGALNKEQKEKIAILVELFSQTDQ